MSVMQSIAEALNDLQVREGERQEYRRFYRGQHGVHLRTPELRMIFRGLCGFSLNFCKTVIDSLTDRVQLKAITAAVSVDGIDDAKEREKIEETQGADATAAAQAIWERSKVDITALAWRYAVDGDAWLGLEITSDEPGGKAEAIIKRLDSSMVAPLSDTAIFVKTGDKTGQVHEGATITFYELGTDGEWRPIVVKGIDGEPDSYLTDVVTVQDGETPIPTLIERIRNGEDDTDWGMSDLAVAVPQQRAINQRVIDIHEVSGNASWPQRWIIGVGAKKIAGALRSRAGAIHGLEGDSLDLKEFSAADPTKLGATLADAVEYLSITTGTPLSSGVGANASGEARRIAQDKLTRRVMKALDVIGEAIERLIESALLIEGIDASVSLDWESPEPVAIKELLETAMLKQSLGVSRHTLLGELGYDPDREEMLRAQERAEEQVALTRALTTGTDTPDDLTDLLGPNGGA